MQMLYNSDQYAVMAFEFGEADAQGRTEVRGGYEIVDKMARRGIVIEGALAMKFQHDVQALVEQGPTEEAMDDYIAGYAGMAQQPVVLH